MARKASPEVQYKNLATAMGKLDREQQLRWVIDFLGQYDKKSILIGGILDALESYFKEQNPDPFTHTVNGAPMTTRDVMNTAYGFGGPKTIEEAVELLWDQGFEVYTNEENSRRVEDGRLPDADPV